MNNLNELSKQIYEGNKLRGFDVSKENIGQTLMLVVSELSEALEADRKGQYAKIDDAEFIIDGKTIREDLDLAIKENGMIKFEDIFRTQVKDTFEDEIADSFIRLFDLCGGLGIDIEKHIDLKLRYNSTRFFKHGKRY
jgi:NTP pyrophosphatase (non-canonical NTP hydrolase)